MIRNNNIFHIIYSTPQLSERELVGAAFGGLGGGGEVK